jgi:hypothetical protein
MDGWMDGWWVVDDRVSKLAGTELVTCTLSPCIDVIQDFVPQSERKQCTSCGLIKHRDAHLLSIDTGALEKRRNARHQ